MTHGSVPKTVQLTEGSDAWLGGGSKLLNPAGGVNGVRCFLFYIVFFLSLCICIQTLLIGSLFGIHLQQRRQHFDGFTERANIS